MCPVLISTMKDNIFYDSNIEHVNGHLCSNTGFCDYKIIDDGILLYLYKDSEFVVCAQTSLEIAIFLLCSGRERSTLW